MWLELAIGIVICVAIIAVAWWFTKPKREG